MAFLPRVEVALSASVRLTSRLDHRTLDTRNEQMQLSSSCTGCRLDHTSPPDHCSPCEVFPLRQRQGRKQPAPQERRESS